MSSSIDYLDSHFDEKIQIIKTCIDWFNSGSLTENKKLVNSISMKIFETKSKIKSLESEIEQNQFLTSKANALNEKSLRLKAIFERLNSIDLPKDMIKPSSRTEIVSSSVHSDGKNKSKQVDSDSLVEKKLNSLTYLSNLKVPEFRSIPAYMKGRLTYEVINKSIDEYNQALKTKYEFYLAGFNPKASLAQKKKFQKMKSLETKETKGLVFLTPEDLKETTCLKTESSRSTFFTILRHLKKIKEFRNAGVVNRYVVLET